MKLYFYSISAIVITFSLLFSACGKEKEDSKKTVAPGRQLEFVKDVTFLNTAGIEIATIDAALADDDNARNQGLMDVKSLPENAGMLFVFPDEAPRSFYMANTPLPLDIIFVNADSSIVRIHHSTTPFSSQSLPSEKPAKYVVETNAGFCVSHDIQEGMRVRF